MKTRLYVFPVIFLFCFAFIQAQEFEVPKQVKLEAALDYVQYEETVIAGINWLEETPVLEQVQKRQETGAFLMSYMTGTPAFSIAIFPFQMELTEKNPPLLMAFLGGWTRFALENPAEKDDALLANKAGINSIIKVYTANKGNGMKKDKKVEKLLKMDEAALEKWISKELGT